MGGSSKRIVLLVVAVAVGTAVGQLSIALQTPTSDRRATAERPGDEQLTLLRAKVGAVSRRVNHLQRQVRVSQPNEPNESAPADEIKQMKPVPQTSSERAAQLSQVLDAEPVDRDWSAARESRIRTALDTDVFDAATVSGLRCQSTMCRVVLDFADAAAMRATVRGIPTNSTFASGGFIHYSTYAGQPRAELFLDRGPTDGANPSEPLAAERAL